MPFFILLNKGENTVKGIKKYLYSIIIASLFFIVAMPNAAKAGTTYTEGSLHYEVEDNSIKITQYFGSKEEETVPAMIAGYPVSTIASGAFSDATTLKKLNLPDTIMTIEKDAIAAGIQIVYNSNTSEPIEREPSQSGENTGNNENNANNGNDENSGNNESLNPADSEKENGDGENNNGNSDNKDKQNPGSQDKNNQDKDDQNKNNQGKDNQDDDAQGVVEEVEVVDLEQSLENAAANNGYTQQSAGIVATGSNATITVDKDNHLIMIDKDGNTKILDDKKQYTVTTDENGKVSIQDEDGKDISVDENGNIKVDGKTKAKIKKDGEVELHFDSEPSNTNMAPVFAVLLVIILAVIAVIFVKQRRR